MHLVEHCVLWKLQFRQEQSVKCEERAQYSELY